MCEANAYLIQGNEKILVMEAVDTVEPEDDGSLIVWACLTGRTYINIETQHGEKEKQKEMLNLADRLCLDEKITLFDYPKEGKQYLNLIEKYADTFSSDEKEWHIRMASQTITESRQQNSYAILVDKLRRRMYLYNSGELAETYRVAFGRKPVERKIMQDNSSTPEGKYRVLRKNPKSSFYKAFYLNYPNAEDSQRFRNAKKERRIPEDATIGGDIEIHGEGIASDWTFGCIAMENEDIDKLWRIIRVGAPVTIVRYLPSGYI
ncbi:MAG: CooT family nickel-binding protein, partial [Proteobacteria bacterium]|nr:CooT family nickel-binding protein [Pseudomonadota bacterium]